MKKLLRSIFTSPTVTDTANESLPTLAAPPATRIHATGTADLDFARALSHENGFPRVDWRAVFAWLDAIENDAEHYAALLACQRAWLGHLRVTLGPRYQMRERGGAILLSSFSERLAGVALDYLVRTRRRIVEVLQGVAADDQEAPAILIVLGDKESYYQYVSHYYAEAGEFALSGGMFLHDGCKHFVMVHDDLTVIEPIIAHELTHACLAHLPLPLWLNEGLAVNTEYRLTRVAPSEWTPEETYAMHQQFWTTETIQEFWSGKAFSRPDEGARLAYDLAQVLTSQLANDWPRMREFALQANWQDAGRGAARATFSGDLGDYAKAILQSATNENWSPDPAQWSEVVTETALQIVSRLGTSCPGSAAPALT
jgi:hypothetical protein